MAAAVPSSVGGEWALTVAMISFFLSVLLVVGVMFVGELFHPEGQAVPREVPPSTHDNHRTHRRAPTTHPRRQQCTSPTPHSLE